MVIMGTNGYGIHKDGEVVIIDLDDPSKTCSAVAKYPINRGMVGTTVGCPGNETVMVCGGQVITSSTQYQTNKCYTLNRSVSFNQFNIKF